MNGKFSQTTIRNKTSELIEHLKKVMPSKELSQRYIKYFQSESKQSASCAVNSHLFLIINQFNFLKVKTRNTGLFFESEFLKSKEHFVEKDFCAKQSK